MLPIITGGHSAYQKHLLEQMRKYYPDPSTISRTTWDIIDRFWHLDLSFTDEFMQDKYSRFGPKPRTPSCMQRSLLLSIAFKIAITEWAAQLKLNPLFAILSGFEFGDTPGVGTFYDFLNRLWDSDSDNFSPHVKPVKKKKVKKPKQKGEKAESVEKVTVDQLFTRLESSVFSIDAEPYSSLFQIYRKEFLDKSVEKGLISPESLAISGDGTPVVTSARERKKRICDCANNGIFDCDCDRLFSQPDCDIGWDSSRDRFYHGYDLYMLVASDSESDLPIFPLLNKASMHDSHAFPETFFRMKSFLPEFHVSKWLLDAAHDAMAYYVHCRKNGITPFIDLNKKRGIQVPYKNDFTIGEDGVPICRAGRRMHHDGSEPSKCRYKFRCPLASRKHGCSCENPCSDSKYGRTVHVAMKDNPRLFNDPPRDSKEWKLEYNARTSSERCIKREKIDFKLEDGKHRSSKMWYCRLYHILMLQHLDAWDLPYESTLQKMILQTA